MTSSDGVLGDQPPLSVGDEPPEEHPERLVWGRVSVVPVVLEDVELVLRVPEVHTSIEGEEGQPLYDGMGRRSRREEKEGCYNTVVVVWGVLLSTLKISVCRATGHFLENAVASSLKV